MTDKHRAALRNLWSADTLDEVAQRAGMRAEALSMWLRAPWGRRALRAAHTDRMLDVATEAIIEDALRRRCG